MPITRYKIAKHAMYVLLAVLLFVLQVTPGLFSIAGVRPMPLIGCAVAIAFLEGETAGAIYGILCGWLCDIYGYDVMWFYTLMLFVLCVLIGVVAKSYLRVTAVNVMLFTFVSAMLIQLVSCLFQLSLWGYEGAGTFLLAHSLPLAIYSGLAAWPVFLLARLIYERLGEAAGRD